LEKKQIKIILLALAGVAALLLMFALFFLSHGTVKAKGFCNFCHTQYYDVEEYAFNEKGGMEAPSGVLVGCAECHPQPYSEFKESAHYDSDREEKPGCSNCHEPHSFATWTKYMFYNPPEWQKVRISIHDNELWEEEVRPDLANKARASFVKNKSKACRECHVKNDNFRKDIKAHVKELEEGLDNVNCIKCHYNLVHDEVDWPDRKEMLGIE